MIKIVFNIDDENVDTKGYEWCLWYYTTERWNEGWYQWNALTYFTPRMTAIYTPCSELVFEWYNKL